MPKTIWRITVLLATLFWTPICASEANNNDDQLQGLGLGPGKILEESIVPILMGHRTTRAVIPFSWRPPIMYPHRPRAFMGSPYFLPPMVSFPPSQGLGMPGTGHFVPSSHRSESRSNKEGAPSPKEGHERKVEDDEEDDEKKDENEYESRSSGGGIPTIPTISTTTTSGPTTTTKIVKQNEMTFEPSDFFRLLKERDAKKELAKSFKSDSAKKKFEVDLNKSSFSKKESSSSSSSSSNTVYTPFNVKLITEMPKVSSHQLKVLLTELFSSPRSDETNQTAKEWIKEKLYRKFKEYGLKTFLHNFTEYEPNEETNEITVIKGTNIIGVLEGERSGTPYDKILLVGAHYDTYKTSPGVNDNGSGMAVLMEIMRNILAANCKFVNTILFVAFDQEELGGLGSYHFVNTYLIPLVLQDRKGTFQGSYILDTILNFNTTEDSQEMPTDFQQALPLLNKYVRSTNHTGDFLSMMSRFGIDTPLSESLSNSWATLDEPNYKLYPMPVELGSMIPPIRVLSARMNFVRSDHAMFWYHNRTNSYPKTLKSVLITDTGPFRGEMKHCYHQECDDLRFVTSENLKQAKKIGDAIIKSLLELGNGSCADQEYLASTYNEATSLTLTIAACVVATFLSLFNYNS